MRISTLFWSAFFVLCSSQISIAQTDKKPMKVGVFPFQSIEQNLSKGDLLSLSRKVLLQFDQNDLYKVIRKYPLVGGQPPKRIRPDQKKKQRQIKILNRFLSNAVKLMQNNAFERVVPLLKLGITKAAKASQWEESFPILSRMCGLWALAAFRMGRGDEGELLLKVLARMNPQPPPPEIKANPQMKFRYARALKSILRKPKGGIKIVGTEGATIFIDGKKAGTIPKEVGGLPKGFHYVRVFKKGHLPWGKAIKVTPGQSATSTVYLKAISSPKRSELDKARFEVKTQVQMLDLTNDKLLSNARTICAQTGAITLLTAHLKKQGGRYALTPIRLDCKAGKALKGTPIAVNDNFIDAELPIYQAMLKLIRSKGKPQNRDKVVARLFPGGGNGTKTKTGNGTKPKAKGAPVHQQWWFWTLIVVGVGGGAAAATTVYLMNQPPRMGVSVKWSFP